jgi:BirA family biotin operon repressor/biotin-[acetyl-CoA-carboxylase] ligase
MSSEPPRHGAALADWQQPSALPACVAALRRHWPTLHAEVLASTTSTNAQLVERLREAGRQPGGDGPAPALLVALAQTAGRGRLGRPWQSHPGASLTFSLAVPLHRADASGLSLAVGLALAQGLDPAGQRLGLKWPNDLWCVDAPGQGRKLAGILIEGLAVAGQRWVVLGIGINIWPLPAEDAAHLATPVASWQELAPAGQASAPAALAAVLPALGQVIQRFEAQGFEALQADFAARDLLRGLPVHTTDAQAPTGVAEGVDGDGALRLRTPDGRLHRVLSGEVSVRPAGMALPG